MTGLMVNGNKNHRSVQTPEDLYFFQIFVEHEFDAPIVHTSWVALFLF